MSLDSDVLWWKGCELRSQGRLKSLSDSSCIYICFFGCLFDLTQILFWISRLWISSTLWTGWSFGDILVYPASTGRSLKIDPNGLVLGAGESSFHCNITSIISIHLRCHLVSLCWQQPRCSCTWCFSVLLHPGANCNDFVVRHHVKWMDLRSPPSW